jgi:hypothetical protein
LAFLPTIEVPLQKRMQYGIEIEKNAGAAASRNDAVWAPKVTYLEPMTWLRLPV